MCLHNGKDKKLSGGPLFKVQQAHLSSLDTDKSEISTRFTWARPVQTNAQCYQFSILCVHLTQIQEIKVFILLDKEQKKLNQEIQNGESLF